MTEAMPELIRNNFIYRRVWNDIHNKDMNSVFLFLGDVGRGKSTGAIRFGQDLDPNFSLERICFTAEEFFTEVEKLSPGSVIIFDEAVGSEEAMDARSALTHTNKILSFFSTISRAKRLIIIYVCPFLSQLDKRLRTIGLTGLVVFQGIDRKRKRGKAVFYWAYGNPLSDKVLKPHPRLKDMSTGELFEVNEITIPKPREELIAEYKQKKDNFINQKIREWKEQLIEKKERARNKKVSIRHYFKKALKDLNNYKDQEGRISVPLLRAKLDLNEKNARMLKSALKNHIINQDKQ